MRERIKVLFLIQVPPPFHGASLRNYELYESIKKRNEFKTELIGVSLAETVDELAAFSFKKVFISLGVFFKLFGKLLFFKPKIVFFSFSPNGWAFLRDVFYSFVLKFSSAKKIFIIREQVNFRKFKKSLLKFILKGVKVISLSKNNKKMLKENGIEDIIIINDRLKLVINEESLSKRRQNNPPTILFLSNLSKEKGVYVFIEALMILKNKGDDFKAEIVGAPLNITEEELKERISGLNLNDRVTYHGFAKGMKRFEFYLKSDIFVLPSLKETFPGVVLEAMQCALPVVSTKEGGIPDIIIDGETGFLVEKGNPSALAEKIEVLLKDKNLAKKMGEKGRERFLKNFTFDKTEEEFVKLFSSLVENNEN